MDTPSFSARCVAFDFEHKRERDLPADEIMAAVDEGDFIWIDIEATHDEAIRAFLGPLGLIGRETLDEALAGQPVTQIARFDDYVHFALSSCVLVRGAEGEEQLELARTDCSIGARFMLTLHRISVLERHDARSSRQLGERARSRAAGAARGPGNLVRVAAAARVARHAPTRS